MAGRHRQAYARQHNPILALPPASTHPSIHPSIGASIRYPRTLVCNDMCTYTHTHAYIYIYIYIYTHTHTHTHKHTHTHTHAITQMNTNHITHAHTKSPAFCGLMPWLTTTDTRSRRLHAASKRIVTSLRPASSTMTVIVALKLGEGRGESGERGGCMQSNSQFSTPKPNS